MSDTPYLDSTRSVMTDQEKATEIRDRLRNSRLMDLLDGAHYIDIVVRINGQNMRFEFDWVKELLK